MTNSDKPNACNYRVIRHRHRDEVSYSVQEVCYDKAGAPHSCSADPLYPYGKTLEELAVVIERYTKAITRPILEYSVFTGTARNQPAGRAGNDELEEATA